MRGSGKFCSSFWSPTKFISVTFIFPWWPVYGKWQRIRLHSCLEQPQTRLCAGSHAGFLLFLGCAGGGILLTLREEYLFSSIPMESFSICSAAHQWSSFFFFKWLNAGSEFSRRHLLSVPFAEQAVEWVSWLDNRMGTSILLLLLSSLESLAGWQECCHRSCPGDQPLRGFAFWLWPHLCRTTLWN